MLLSRLKTWELEEGESNGPVQEHGQTSKAFTVKNGDKRPKKTKEEIAEIKKRTKCHICKRKGHWKSECRNKKQESQGESSSERNEEKKTPAIAYMAGPSENLWINDSGASQHYCGKMEWFCDFQKFQTPKPVSIADNSVTHATGVGIVRLKAMIQGSWKLVELHNVMYIPGGANLFSENVMLTKGFEVKKDLRIGKVIYYLNGHPDIEATFENGLQIMKFIPIENKAMVCVQPQRWHER